MLASDCRGTVQVLPAPPRPATSKERSKPPRPWPGARTSSPAQMPPGSRRVGTCPWPRAGIGTRAARPPHLCLPDFLPFCAQFPRVGSGSCPSPRRSRKPEGRGFPKRLYRGSRRPVGAVLLVPGLGWCSIERQVGGQTGLGSGTRGRLALVESVLRPPSKPRTAQPDQARGRSPGVGVRLRKRKPLDATTSR